MLGGVETQKCKAFLRDTQTTFLYFSMGPPQQRSRTDPGDIGQKPPRGQPLSTCPLCPYPTLTLPVPPQRGMARVPLSSRAPQPSDQLRNRITVEFAQLNNSQLLCPHLSRWLSSKGVAKVTGHAPYSIASRLVWLSSTSLTTYKIRILTTNHSSQMCHVLEYDKSQSSLTIESGVHLDFEQSVARNRSRQATEMSTCEQFGCMQPSCKHRSLRWGRQSVGRLHCDFRPQGHTAA